MYVILVYDMEEKRVGKMLKLCRRYLNWIQNSVFEGEITDVQLKTLLSEAKEIMHEEKDSIILFQSRQEKWLNKVIIGREKNKLDNIL
jgi:CRISPR-associated protein Cas2